MSHPSYFPPPPMSPWRYPISTLGPLDDGVVPDGGSSPFFHSAPASVSPFSTAHHFYSSQPLFATSVMTHSKFNATTASQAAPPLDTLVNSMSALQIQDDSLALIEAAPPHITCSTSTAPYHMDIPTRTRRWGARYVDTGIQTDDQPSQTPEATKEISLPLKRSDTAHGMPPSPSASTSPATADLICLDSDDLKEQNSSPSTMASSPSASASVQEPRKVESDSSDSITSILSKSEDEIKPVIDAYIGDLRRHFKFEEVEAAAQRGQTPEWLLQESLVIANVPASYLRSAIKSDPSMSGGQASSLQTSAEEVPQPATTLRSPQQTPNNPEPNSVASNVNKQSVKEEILSTKNTSAIKEQPVAAELRQHLGSDVLSAQAIEEAFASNAARTRALVRPQILELGSASSTPSPESVPSPTSATMANLGSPPRSPPPSPPEKTETCPEGTLHTDHSSIDVSATTRSLVDIDPTSTAQAATPERKEVAKVLVDVPKASYNAKEEEKRPASPVVGPAKVVPRIPLQSWPMLLERPLSRSEDQVSADCRVGSRGYNRTGAEVFAAQC